MITNAQVILHLSSKTATVTAFGQVDQHLQRQHLFLLHHSLSLPLPLPLPLPLCVYVHVPVHV